MNKGKQYYTANVLILNSIVYIILYTLLKYDDFDNYSSYKQKKHVA